MLLPVLLLLAASSQTCAGASAPIVGTIRSTAASDASKFRLIGCKDPKAGQSAQTVSVSTTFSGIECGLALVLSLLACCWMPVQTRLSAGTRGRATWGLWTGIVLVVLSCLPAGQAAKPRPQMTLPYFPWRHGLPSTRNTHAMAAAGDDSVWLHGGETAEGFSDQLFKLDP